MFSQTWVAETYLCYFSQVYKKRTKGYRLCNSSHETHLLPLQLSRKEKAHWKKEVLALYFPPFHHFWFPNTISLVLLFLFRVSSGNLLDKLLVVKDVAVVIQQKREICRGISSDDTGECCLRKQKHFHTHSFISVFLQMIIILCFSLFTSSLIWTEAPVDKDGGHDALTPALV